MKPVALLLTSLFIAQFPLLAAHSSPTQFPTQLAQADIDENLPTPQQVQQTAKNITVRISADKNSGSGVLIAKKGSTYLVLTNAHVVSRSTKFQIQAPDGQKHNAQVLNGGFDPKYDLALLQFTSPTRYNLADLSDVASPLAPERTIYSAGFPFDAKNIRITSGQVSQLSDIPFDDGTQIGYTTNKGEKGIRQGMSGGAILDGRGKFLGINTLGAAPILPNYTYNDGSKPPSKLTAKYRQSNWGVPVYNFLTNVKPDILYGYDNLPKVERQVTPTGYLARLNIKARQMTVRIETGSGNGSGVIVAKQGNSYYVLTAKHVVQNLDTKQLFTNLQLVTYDQDRYGVAGTVVAEGVDLAVVKFSSNTNYPLAQLGQQIQNTGDFVFVGGFPGRETINSPLWQWQLNPGYVNDKEQGKLNTQDTQSFSNGYDLIYGSISYGGMSGGPVFNSAGNVIGIHGRTESTDLNSLGISIETFIGLAAKLRISPNLLNIAKANYIDLSPEDRRNIIAAMQNIPQPPVGADGKRWLAYGNQLYRTRQYNLAIAAFDRAINDRQILFGNYGKSLSLANTGKYKSALDAIIISIQSSNRDGLGKYYYFWKYKSVIYSSLGNYAEALKAIDIAIQLEKNDLTLLNEKGLILCRYKKYPDAIAIYDLIIRKQPGSSAYNNRGNAKSDLGNKQAAIADYDRAIQLNPNHANAYSNRGNAKSDLGNKQAAIIDYGRAIQLNPNHANAYINRGIAKSALGNKQAAIIDCDRAIQLNPNLAEAYISRGNAKSDLGNKQAAVADYDRAIQLNPNFTEAYYNRGNAKSDLGNKQAAIIDYDRAIQLNPNDANAYSNRGIAKYALRNKQAAIIDYDRAIQLNPNLAEAYYNRGNAKSALGNKQAAIVDYDRAIQLNPNDAKAYYNRGNTKSALGNKQAAITDMNTSAELFRQQKQMDLYQKAIESLKKLQGG
jgi:tetratricopeptide (TPR) repeat protein/S1-C subfamily serine protease